MKPDSRKVASPFILETSTVADPALCLDDMAAAIELAAKAARLKRIERALIVATLGKEVLRERMRKRVTFRTLYTDKCSI